MHYKCDDRHILYIEYATRGAICLELMNCDHGVLAVVEKREIKFKRQDTFTLEFFYPIQFILYCIPVRQYNTSTSHSDAQQDHITLWRAGGGISPGDTCWGHDIEQYHHAYFSSLL